jgi:transposase
MRVEVLDGVERRRRWSSDDKTRMVAETLVPGAKVTEVARRNGVSVSLLFTWRRQARSKFASEAAAKFVPVRIAGREPGEAVLAPNCATTPAEPIRSAPTGRRGMIEIDLGSHRRIRVDAQFDADALARIIEVLERR